MSVDLPEPDGPMIATYSPQRRRPQALQSPPTESLRRRPQHQPGPSRSRAAAKATDHAGCDWFSGRTRAGSATRLGTTAPTQTNPPLTRLGGFGPRFNYFWGASP